METLFSVLNTPVSIILAVFFGFGVIAASEIYGQNHLKLRMIAQLIVGYVLIQFYDWVVNTTEKSEFIQIFLVLSVAMVMAALSSTFQLLSRRKKL